MLDETLINREPVDIMANGKQKNGLIRLMIYEGNQRVEVEITKQEAFNAVRSIMWALTAMTEKEEPWPPRSPRLTVPPPNVEVTDGYLRKLQEWRDKIKEATDDEAPVLL